MATKPAKKASVKSAKPQNALQKPLQPSAELAAIVGSDPVSRGEVTSKVWDYIKSHNLQNPENRREILADDKLRKVFGKDKVTMFEMTKYLSQHLTCTLRPSAPATLPSSTVRLGRPAELSLGNFTTARLPGDRRG